jgi:hypothetical protein
MPDKTMNCMDYRFLLEGMIRDDSCHEECMANYGVHFFYPQLSDPWCELRHGNTELFRGALGEGELVPIDRIPGVMDRVAMGEGRPFEGNAA